MTRAAALTVADLLDCRRRERKAALVEGASGTSVTWSDVADLSDALRANRARICDEGERPVGLLLGAPVAGAATFAALLAAGVTVAPLNPAGTAGELARQCRDLGVASVLTDVTDRGVIAALTDAGSAVWNVTVSPATAGPDGITSSPARDCGPLALSPARDCGPLALSPARDCRRIALSPARCRTGSPPPLPPGGAALVLTSSGTTGRPKIVPLTEAQLVDAAQRIARHHELGPSDRGYSPLPLFHINGLVVGVLATLVSGGSLVVDKRFSRGTFWSTVRSQHVTWLNLVPAIITALGTEEAAGDARVRLAGTGGVRFARSASAPLAEAARLRFEERTAIPVVETYGMTEAASQITANQMTPAERRAGSVGCPVGIELRVVDTAGRIVPAGIEGEVQIGGDAVTAQYWNPAGESPPTRSASAEGGWLATGDVGWVDGDGFLFLVGRSDDVINRGGEKVHPREVEDVLLADPRVVAAVVVGRPHPTFGHEPVAFVLASTNADGRDGLVDDLTRQCAEALSRYKRPSCITVTDTLPVGATGKVRRRDLLDADGRSSTMTVGSTGPPRSPGSRQEPFGLVLPDRSAKPRTSGLTFVIDNGLPRGYFADAMTSAADHIDVVKFGWGTALVTPHVEMKLACLRELGIGFCFGGTLFEKFVVQDRFPQFMDLCRRFGCELVEVSNGTIPLTNREKSAYIAACAREFQVISEVGVKDVVLSEALDPAAWVAAVAEDLDAGASLVIAEARESGRSGICHADGTLRLDIVEEILSSGVDPTCMVFEAPTKDLQAQFISRLGPSVNLGNVAPGDAIGVETLRLGLRSDTLMRMEQVDA